MVAPQLKGAQQQLGEVDHAGAAAGVLVGRIHLDHHAPRAVALVGERRWPPAFVLLRIDEVLQVLRHPACLVELECPDHLLDQAQLVLGVEDLEGLRQARLAPVQAQQAMREAVERADPKRAARHAEQRLDAAAHLAGGLVGEGHREDRVRRGAVLRDQPGDAVHEHARLAAAGPGEHEYRAGRRADGGALRIVELREEGFGLHGRDSIGSRATRLRSVRAR